MSTPTAVAAALRSARKAKGVSIADLAARSGVSPRLISEFERGKRPHVSLTTTLRLLSLLDVRIAVEGAPSADQGRAERAALRRRTWVGRKGTVARQGAPDAPATGGERLLAVAGASRLAVGLRAARRTAR